MMNAALILVGTELLNGKMVDTNSIYMAEELNKYGIKIKFKTVVPDHIDEIIKTLDYAKKNVDLVIMSGGLGPTIDDLTKEAVSRYLGKELIIEEKELLEIREKFKNIGVEFIESNKKEVEKPVGAISFPNGAGMAPAIYIDGIACFPGVPIELFDMFPKFLNWYKKEKNLDSDNIFIKDLLTYGIPESHLDRMLTKLFTDENIEYEFLVKKFGIIIRLQTNISNKNIVEKISEKIYNIIGDNIFGENEDRLESLILKKLEEKNLKLSVAESLTGGMLADAFIKVSGASKVFMEGIVSYSNEAKMKRLFVNEESLLKYGAVSKQVAEEMVRGLETEVGISTTGIAGPTGGSDEKPVGLVYIGLKINDKIRVEKRVFKGSREEVRRKAVLDALFELNKFLNN